MGYLISLIVDLGRGVDNPTIDVIVLTFITEVRTGVACSKIDKFITMSEETDVL